MALDSEAVLAALFARLQAKMPSVKTFTRRAQGFENIQPSQQPALILESGEETPANTPKVPALWTISATIGVLATTPTTETNPEAQFHAILREIRAALAIQPGESGEAQTTLGGKCVRCWIAGTVHKEPGTLGGQGALLVPIEILAVG